MMKRDKPNFNTYLEDAKKELAYEPEFLEIWDRKYDKLYKLWEKKDELSKVIFHFLIFKLYLLINRN